MVAKSSDVSIILNPLSANHNCSRPNLDFFFFVGFFREIKAWHFIWIVCQVDNSHAMPSLVFSEKKKKMNKKFFKLSSATILLSTLRGKTSFNPLVEVWQFRCCLSLQEELEYTNKMLEILTVTDGQDVVR